MLKLTRVSKSMDVGRLGQAVSRPGIDPRTWVSYAIVDAVTLDPGHGVIVDVTLMPSGAQGSARVGQEYAGSGFGLHVPIGVDDEVLVEACNGDPDHGYVVTKRFHSPSDPPSEAAVGNPDDFVIVVKSGQSLRIVVQDGGKIVLGDADADDPVIRKSDLDKLVAAYNQHTHVASGSPTSTTSAPQSSIDGSSTVVAT